MYQFMNTKRLQSCIIMIELDDKDNKLLSLGISILYVVLRISFFVLEEGIFIQKLSFS